MTQPEEVGFLDQTSEDMVTGLRAVAVLIHVLDGHLVEALEFQAARLITR